MQENDKKFEQWQHEQDIPQEERVTTKYNPQELIDIKKEIILTIGKMGVYLERLNKLQDDREDIEKIKQQLHDLQQYYNKLLSKISPQQQN